jgi:short-subunit dehydrogenase
VSVNLQAPAVLAAGIVPHMATRGGGQIVFIASMAGKVATLGNGPLYTATKWGLRGLGLALRGTDGGFRPSRVSYRRRSAA